MKTKGFLLSTAIILASLCSYGQGKIVFEEMDHDFGTVIEGDQAAYEFEFKNEGNEPFTLTQVKPSCGCTTPFYTKDPVAPGEVGKIKVSYNSKGRPGAFTKHIRVSSTAENAGETLVIKGVVDPKPDTVYSPEALANSPRLVLDKDSYYFGKIERNKYKKYTFDITNKGADTLRVKDIKAGCKCVDHTLTKEYLLPGESATLTLNYFPRTEGEAKEIVVIYSNDLHEPKKIITLSASVTGSLVEPSLMREGGGFGF